MLGNEKVGGGRRMQIWGLCGFTINISHLYTRGQIYLGLNMWVRKTVHWDFIRGC